MAENETAGGVQPASPASAVSAPAAAASAPEPISAQAEREKAAAKLAKREADSEYKRPVLLRRAITAEREIDSYRSKVEELSAKAKSADEFKAKYEGTLKTNALQAAAQKLGIRDVDYLKLADLSKVTIDGESVKGAADAVKALKESHPDLFGPGDRKEVQPTVTTDRPNGGPSPAFDPSAQYSPEQIKRFTAEQREAWKKANGLGSGNYRGTGSEFVWGEP